LLFCLSSLQPCTQIAQAADSNLVLHMEFDSGVTSAAVIDTSGHNNNGWQFNPTNFIKATNGAFGTPAAQFTYAGIMSNDPPHFYQFSQYVAVTNLSGFSYLTNGTISVWARFDSNADLGMYLLDSGYSVTYATDPASASNSWTLGRYNTSHLSLFTYTASGNRIIVDWPEDTVQPGGFTPNLSTTKLHLYSVTLDCPNNRAIAYYDGSPYLTNTVGVPWLRIYGTASIRWLCIGAMAHDGTPEWGDDNYPNAGFFVGRMDDLRIYNRTLRPEEVQAIYLGADSKAKSQATVTYLPGAQSVKLTWVGQSNTYYQPESRLDLFTGAWTSLGAPILSGGGTNSVTDAVAGSKRFYRVRPLP
jgi:hypothetical protein